MSPSRESLTRLEREEPILEFLFCKKLAYDTRMNITYLLVALGIVLQIVFVSVFPGIPFLVAGLLISWVVGIDNKFDPRRYRRGANWETVEYGRLSEILAIDKKMKRWDESFTDITNLRGLAFWMVVVLCIALATAVLHELFSLDVAVLFAVDGLLLVLLQWVSGMRAIHRQPELTFKTACLATVSRHLPIGGEDGPHLGAQLLVGGDADDSVPLDAKLTVTFPDGPSHFYGVQGQVVVNRVQGKAYPYFYAVLVAEAGHGLIEATEDMQLPSKVIRETKTKGDVEVVIVRQFTTSTGGYHTSTRKSQSILEAAVQAASEYAG